MKKKSRLWQLWRTYVVIAVFGSILALNMHTAHQDILPDYLFWPMNIAISFLLVLTLLTIDRNTCVITKATLCSFINQEHGETFGQLNFRACTYAEMSPGDAGWVRLDEVRLFSADAGYIPSDILFSVVPEGKRPILIVRLSNSIRVIRFTAVDRLAL